MGFLGWDRNHTFGFFLYCVLNLYVLFNLFFKFFSKGIHRPDVGSDNDLAKGSWPNGNLLYTII